MRALAISVLVALPTVASANYAFQGIVSLTGGYTSNAANAPAGSSNSDPDGVIFVSPTVVFTSAVARAMQRVSYNFLAQFYVTHPELTALSNRLDWTGDFILTPTATMQLSSYVLQSQLNSAVVDATNPQLTTVGTSRFWGAGLTQQLTWDWSQKGRLTEGFTFSAYLPVSSTLGASYLGSATLGLARVFRRDILGSELQLGYNNYQATHGPITNSDGSITPNGVVSPTQQQIVINALGKWRRDFDAFWNVNLGAGVGTVFRATDGSGNIWQPIGEAGAHYTHPKFNFDFTYRRALMANPIVQNTFISDTLALHATVPFGVKSRVTFVGGGSFVHYQDADTFSGSLSTQVNQFIVDASLLWSPYDWLLVATRYTYQNQLAESGNPPLASIERHMILLSLTVTYPAQGAAMVTMRQPVRVDRTDAPAFPELHAPVDNK